jgi:hypothetical protein
MEFNGCKMKHIWKLENNLYTDEFLDDEAKEALEHGTLLNKVDGSNHCLFKEGDQWVLYGRYDDKKGKLDEKKLPEQYRLPPQGRNLQVYVTSVRHAYYYVRRPRPVPNAKGKLNKSGKVSKVLYEIIDRNTTRFNKMGVDYLTVEVVGTKFNKAPGLDFPCGLALHCDQVFDQEFKNIPRTKEGLQKLLSEVCTEGVVLLHNNKCWKVRSNCFDKECLFETAKRAGISPDNLVPVKLLA